MRPSKILAALAVAAVVPVGAWAQYPTCCNAGFGTGTGYGQWAWETEDQRGDDQLVLEKVKADTFCTGNVYPNGGTCSFQVYLVLQSRIPNPFDPDSGWVDVPNPNWQTYPATLRMACPRAAGIEGNLFGGAGLTGLNSAREYRVVITFVAQSNCPGAATFIEYTTDADMP